MTAVIYARYSSMIFCIRMIPVDTLWVQAAHQQVTKHDTVRGVQQQ